MIVLDTNVISELMRAQPAPAVLEWVDRQRSSSLAITAITAAELLYGVCRLPDGARKSALGEALHELLGGDLSGRVLPFDVAAAGYYAELVVARERRGRPVSVADGQIAAICRCRGARLATRNGQDFDATGVEVLNPWTAA